MLQCVIKATLNHMVLEEKEGMLLAGVTREGLTGQRTLNMEHGM